MLYSTFKTTLVLLTLAGTSLLAQQAPISSCAITSVTPIVHAEGVAERMGDIVFDCTGPSGVQITGNLSIFLNTAVTNKQSSTGTIDAVLTVNGSLANVQGILNGTNQLAFNGLQFTFPADGRVQLRISNIRADATFGGSATPPANPGLPGQPITAQLAFSPPNLLAYNRFTVQIGLPQRGLLVTSLNTLIPSQFGSVLPDNLGSFTAFITKRTFFATTRVTEGFESAFQPRGGTDDTGTRIILRFTGYPSDARLFVPAVIAGSSAAVPTSTGDFGSGFVSPGDFTPGSKTLGLAAVLNADPNGAGGYIPAAVSDQMVEIPLLNGSGLAVFEVIGGDPQLIENAQIPVFIGLDRSIDARTNILSTTLSFGPLLGNLPLSSVTYPRFRPYPVQSDCVTYSDCNTYNSKLGAPPTNTNFQLRPGGNAIQTFYITNQGGNPFMPFTASVDYKQGSGWIRLDTSSDLQARPIRMVVIATPQMAPGIYEATVTIDAGSAGVAHYDVRLEVLAPDTTPKISQVLNGASFESGPVARNAYYTLKGENLTGNTVAVTFDGKPAKVIYSSATQINFLVPSDLAGNTSQLVVSVNGVASQATTVQVTEAAPGVFDPGILNQDGTVNSPSNPAVAGSVVQIFATGVLGPNGSGAIDLKLHDLTITNPAYAGAAPGIPGLQQVNVLIPQYYPTMTTQVSVCTTATGTRICSAPVKIHIRQAQ